METEHEREDGEALPLTLHYSQTQLLARGWTRTMIDRLLGPPDAIDRRCGEQRFCFVPQRVHAAESTEEFLERKRRAQLRNHAMQAAIAARRKTAVAAASNVVLSVPRMTSSALTHRAIRAYNRTTERRRATTTSDRTFLAYITVHWLCHQVPEYARAIAATKGQVGRWEAYYRLRSRLLEAIAAAYPHLAEECSFQRASELPADARIVSLTIEDLEDSTPDPDELSLRIESKRQAAMAARASCSG